METIMVTGGAGYVGSGLLRALLRSGYRVVCVDCLKFGGESIIDVWHEPNFTFFKVDVNKYEEFEQVLKKYDYDAVVHLAAIVGDPACKRESELAVKTNWESSKWFLDRCMELGIPRFTFASTCSNYGKMADSKSYVDENSPLSPVSLYAEMKVKFETYLLHEVEKKETFCPTSLRFSTVYGLSPRMRFDLTVNEFTKDLALGKELLVFGEQFWRPYCHVADFSRAFMTVLEASSEKVAYQVFNVGDTKENYTKQMIVEEIKKQIPEARIKYVHKDEDPRDYRVNFDKIHNELGFVVSNTVPDGIREVKEIVRSGVIQDPEAQRYYNIPHKRES
jgi:nucleoside-diphosphate-sugar epimerase